MNLGLLGALGGLGQGMQQVGAGMIKQQDDALRDERSLIMQKNLLQARDDMDAAKARRISGEVNAEAGRIASTRATGLLASSREAVANAGNQDDPAVAKGLNDAQAEMSVPTTRDNIQASVNLGHTNPIELLKIDSDERRTKIAEDANAVANKRLDITAMRDEARQALQERKLDIDSKKVDAMISGIGAWAKSTGAGSSKTTAMIQNYAELERRGYSQDKIEKILFDGKDSGYETVATEGYDASGNKVTTTKKVAGSSAPAVPAAGNPGLDLSKFNKK